MEIPETTASQSPVSKARQISPKDAEIRSLKAMLAADGQIIRELRALLILHHAVGVLDGALVGERCPLCAPRVDARGKPRVVRPS